jgi:hypothetical protein
MRMACHRQAYVRESLPNKFEYIPIQYLWFTGVSDAIGSATETDTAHLVGG